MPNKCQVLFARKKYHALSCSTYRSSCSACNLCSTVFVQCRSASAGCIIEPSFGWVIPYHWPCRLGASDEGGYAALRPSPCPIPPCSPSRPVGLPLLAPSQVQLQGTELDLLLHMWARASAWRPCLRRCLYQAWARCPTWGTHRAQPAQHDTPCHVPSGKRLHELYGAGKLPSRVITPLPHPGPDQGSCRATTPGPHCTQVMHTLRWISSTCSMCVPTAASGHPTGIVVRVVDRQTTKSATGTQLPRETPQHVQRPQPAKAPGHSS